MTRTDWLGWISHCFSHCQSASVDWHIQWEFNGKMWAILAAINLNWGWLESHPSKWWWLGDGLKVYEIGLTTLSGGLLKGGVPLNHPFLDGIFPYKPSSYWGTPKSRNSKRLWVRSLGPGWYTQIAGLAGCNSLSHGHLAICLFALPGGQPWNWASDIETTPLFRGMG